MVAVMFKQAGYPPFSPLEVKGLGESGGTNSMWRCYSSVGYQSPGIASYPQSYTIAHACYSVPKVSQCVTKTYPGRIITRLSIGITPSWEQLSAQ